MSQGMFAALRRLLTLCHAKSDLSVVATSHDFLKPDKSVWHFTAQVRVDGEDVEDFDLRFEILPARIRCAVPDAVL